MCCGDDDEPLPRGLDARISLAANAPSHLQIAEPSRLAPIHHITTLSRDSLTIQQHSLRSIQDSCIQTLQVMPCHVPAQPLEPMTTTCAFIQTSIIVNIHDDVDQHQCLLLLAVHFCSFGRLRKTFGQFDS